MSPIFVQYLLGSLQEIYSILYYIMAQNENLTLINNKQFGNICKLNINDVVTYNTQHDTLINIIKHYNKITNNILLTCGSNEAINLLFKHLVTDNMNIIIESPTYSYTENICKALPTTRISFREKDLFKDVIIDSYLQTDNNLLYLCNPNNPNNTTFTKFELLNLIHNPKIKYIIIDEAYIEFYNEDESIINLVDLYDNLYVIRTFSKYYGLAGLRLGYIVSQKSLNHLENNRLINGIVTSIALKCFIPENLHMFKQNKLDYNNTISKLEHILKKNNYHIYNGINKSNFILIYVGSYINHFMKLLTDNNISVKNIDPIYKMHGYIRLGMFSFAQLPIVEKIFDFPFNEYPIYNYFYSNNYHLKCLSLFNSVMNVFNSLSFNVCITDGTLLGHFRCNNILPWDDDIDLCYFENYDMNILQQELHIHNLRLRKNRTNAYWQIDIPDTDKLNEIHIDLFPYIQKNNTYINNDIRFQTNNENNKECNLIYDLDIYPFKEITFSQFKIKTNITNNALTSLYNSMGNDVLNIIKIKDNATGKMQKYINFTYN